MKNTYKIFLVFLLLASLFSFPSCEESRESLLVTFPPSLEKGDARFTLIGKSPITRNVDARSLSFTLEEDIWKWKIERRGWKYSAWQEGTVEVGSGPTELIIQNRTTADAVFLIDTDRSHTTTLYTKGAGENEWSKTKVKLSGKEENAIVIRDLPPGPFYWYFQDEGFKKGAVSKTELKTERENLIEEKKLSPLSHDAVSTVTFKVWADDSQDAFLLIRHEGMTKWREIPLRALSETMQLLVLEDEECGNIEWRGKRADGSLTTICSGVIKKDAEEFLLDLSLPTVEDDEPGLLVEIESDETGKRTLCWMHPSRGIVEKKEIIISLRNGAQTYIPSLGEGTVRLWIERLDGSKGKETLFTIKKGGENRVLIRHEKEEPSTPAPKPGPEPDEPLGPEENKPTPPAPVVPEEGKTGSLEILIRSNSYEEADLVYRIPGTNRPKRHHITLNGMLGKKYIFNDLEQGEMVWSIQIKGKNTVTPFSYVEIVPGIMVHDERMFMFDSPEPDPSVPDEPERPDPSPEPEPTPMPDPIVPPEPEEPPKPVEKQKIEGYLQATDLVESWSVDFVCTSGVTDLEKVWYVDGVNEGKASSMTIDKKSGTTTVKCKVISRELGLLKNYSLKLTD